MKKERIKNAEYLIKNLPSNGFFQKQKVSLNVKSAFVRLYLVSKSPTEKVNVSSNNLDIQFRHLKSRFGSIIQDNFRNDQLINTHSPIPLSESYFSLHNNLISIPLSSKMSFDDKNNIIKFLKLKSNENNN